MSEYEGRLLLPRDDTLLIVWDEKGVIGSVSPKRLVGVLLGLGSADITPALYACRSRSGKAFCFVTRGGRNSSVLVSHGILRRDD